MISHVFASGIHNDQSARPNTHGLRAITTADHDASHTRSIWPDIAQFSTLTFTSEASVHPRHSRDLVRKRESRTGLRGDGFSRAHALSSARPHAPPYTEIFNRYGPSTDVYRRGCLRPPSQTVGVIKVRNR